MGEDLILPRFVEAAKFWLTELRILRKYQSQSFQFIIECLERGFIMLVLMVTWVYPTAYSSNMTRYSQLTLQSLVSYLPVSLCRRQGRMWKRKCGRSLMKLDTYLELSQFVEPTKLLVDGVGKVRVIIRFRTSRLIEKPCCFLGMYIWNGDLRKCVQTTHEVV